jgi:hypothetical protein
LISFNLQIRYDCDGGANDKEGFTSWLNTTPINRQRALFLANCNRYAKYVHASGMLSPYFFRLFEGSTEPSMAAGLELVSTMSASTEANPANQDAEPPEFEWKKKEKAQLGPEWHPGLRKVPVITGLNVEDLRILYAGAMTDRWRE